MDLKSRLIAAADAWAAAWAAAEGAEVPPTRLAKLVMDDGKFFVRLGEARKGPSTDTLEKFARFLVDPANWPADADGLARIPEAAALFGHVVGVRAESPPESPDNRRDSIGAGHPIDTVTPVAVSDRASGADPRGGESPGAEANDPVPAPGGSFDLTNPVAKVA